VSDEQPEEIGLRGHELVTDGLAVEMTVGPVPFSAMPRTSKSVDWQTEAPVWVRCRHLAVTASGLAAMDLVLRVRTELHGGRPVRQAEPKLLSQTEDRADATRRRSHAQLAVVTATR
jgi:hypothetical protein